MKYHFGSADMNINRQGSSEVTGEGEVSKTRICGKPGALGEALVVLEGLRKQSAERADDVGKDDITWRHVRLDVMVAGKF